MNVWQHNFIFLSQLTGIPVIDQATGKRIGTTVDIVASLKDTYPKAAAVVMRAGALGERKHVPWRNVRRVEEGRAIYVDAPAAGERPAENEILLRDTFWDKQIVDISGSKVVRVNDLHLLREEQNLWVVHMDIGLKGLIRRLGWTRPVDFILRWLFSYELKDKLISWKFVQPISSTQGADLLSLKLTGSRLSELHPADLADILIDLGTDERVVILKTLDTVTAASTFTELPLKMRLQVAETLELGQLAPIVGEMQVDEAVDLIARLPRRKVNSLFAQLPPDRVTQIRGLLDLSERTAGSIVNTQFISVQLSQTAGQVLEKIRAEGKNKETVYYVYVTDDSGSLAGVATLRQLLTAPPERPVSELMRKRVVKTRIDADVKTVAEIFYKYDFTVVPVVDRGNKLLGIISIKDAFEAVFPEIREEAEEMT